jgi:hypothetical protein
MKFDIVLPCLLVRGYGEQLMMDEMMATGGMIFVS